MMGGKKEERRTGQVQLMTLHTLRQRLEFPYVFIMRMEDGRWIRPIVISIPRTIDKDKNNKIKKLDKKL